MQTLWTGTRQVASTYSLFGTIPKQQALVYMEDPVVSCPKLSGIIELQLSVFLRETQARSTNHARFCLREISNYSVVGLDRSSPRARDLCWGDTSVLGAPLACRLTKPDPGGCGSAPAQPAPPSQGRGPGDARFPLRSTLRIHFRQKIVVLLIGSTYVAHPSGLFMLASNW